MNPSGKGMAKHLRAAKQKSDTLSVAKERLDGKSKSIKDLDFSKSSSIKKSSGPVGKRDFSGVAQKAIIKGKVVAAGKRKFNHGAS